MPLEFEIKEQASSMEEAFELSKNEIASVMERFMSDIWTESRTTTEAIMNMQKQGWADKDQAIIYSIAMNRSFNNDPKFSMIASFAKLRKKTRSLADQTEEGALDVNLQS